MPARILLWSVIAGALAAAFAIAFGQTLARFAVHGGPAVLIAPALAGLLYGPLVAASPGGGIPLVHRAFTSDSPVGARAAGGHAVAAGLTLGAGGSAGTEGPIIHLAAALGSALAQLAAVPVRPVAVAAVAGGIGGSFEAPLTGIVLVVEVLLVGMTGLEFAAVVAGSVAGTLTAHVMPGAPVRLPGVVGTVDVLGIVVASVLAAAAGVILVRSLHLSRLVAAKRWRAAGRPRPAWWRPAVGGLAAGPILWAIPQLGGAGPDLFAGVTAGATGTLLLLAAGKIVTTSVTFAAGGVGGTIGPMLVVGAAVGAAVPVAGGVAVGMAACLAAAGRAPVTAVVLAVELGGLDLLPAILPAAVIGRLLGGLLLRDTVFGTGTRVDTT